jgi:hypothetical protein
VFSPLPTLATKIAGRPMIATIVGPKTFYTVVDGYTKLDVAGTSFPLVPQQTAEVTIVSPNSRNARLTFRAQTKTSGTFLVFQSAADDKTTSTLIRDGSDATLPLHLQRGVNYIIVGLTAGVDVPSGTPMTVRLRDVRLR